MTSDKPHGPVLIELDTDTPQVTPADAPPVPDAATDLPKGAAMQTVATLATRPRSRLARWFWSLFFAVLGFFISLSAWNAVTALVAANPLLGYAATALIAGLVVVSLAIAVREFAAFARLGRMDRLHAAAVAALEHQDLGEARQVTGDLVRLYGARPETQWGRNRFAELSEEVFDADGLLGLAEREILRPLDAAATREVEAAARQVATVTALVPLALIDVLTALSTNLRMIRRIAEIYGGRSGTLGAWRLTRAVLSHLVATGAVAVGDDMIGSLAGGGLLAKLSRRFGEGLVNGALTARVGIAAIEVCRPLPFQTEARPGVTGLVRRALTGLFDRKD
ncbi:MAG: TIGR01620 family protein [Pseudomonadota bacterium]